MEYNIYRNGDNKEILYLRTRRISSPNFHFWDIRSSSLLIYLNIVSGYFRDNWWCLHVHGASWVVHYTGRVEKWSTYFKFSRRNRSFKKWVKIFHFFFSISVIHGYILEKLVLFVSEEYFFWIFLKKKRNCSYSKNYFNNSETPSVAPSKFQINPTYFHVIFFLSFHENNPLVHCARPLRCTSIVTLGL